MLILYELKYFLKRERAIDLVVKKVFQVFSLKKKYKGQDSSKFFLSFNCRHASMHGAVHGTKKKIDGVSKQNKNIRKGRFFLCFSHVLD